jgi:Secretion system C-terminal sorting domain
MKTFTLTRKLFFLSMMLAFIGEVNAQNSPIVCDGKFLVSHGTGNSSTSTTSIKQLSFSGSTINAAAFTTSPSGMGYNAIGINPIDGYMYGVRYPASNAKPRLIRIGTGGTNVTDLGTINNTNNNEIAYAGCFDADGTFYFTTEDDRLLKIVQPVTSRNAVQVGTYNSSIGTIVDIAINPVDGQMYAANTSMTLYKVNKTTGALTSVGTLAGGSNYFAGLFFTENGTLYGYRADGEFFLINKTTAALTSAGTGPAFTYADGCSCSFRVAHTMTAPLAVCPTSNNPNPEFDLTVSVQNSSNITQSSLTYELTIPSNRFSFIETPAVIAQRLFNQGLLPSNNASQITISNSGVTPATVKNKITISSFQSPFSFGDANNNNRSFTLKIKLVTLGAPYANVSIQSRIGNLPGGIGGEDMSDNPNTGSPDDATTISFCAISTLPVNLLSFTGSLKDNKSLLNWETQNEVNFDRYEIERSTTSSSNFSTKALVFAQSGGAYTFKYQYNDDLSTVDGNIFYYRLKMIDLDGTYTYSEVIMVRRDQKTITGINISPNPVYGSGIVTIRLSAEKRKTVDISVYNVSGKMVLRQQNQLNAGVNSISIKNMNLQSGIYTIQVVAEDEILSSKLSVIR